MIAIPVKTNKENPAVSTLFGKSKWFALIDGEQITIEANQTESGRQVVENMIAKGVDKLVFHHMGGNPFMLLQRGKVTCYHSGGERILLQDVLAKLQNDELVKVDGTNMSDFVEQGNMHNGGGHHNHNHDHHHDHDHHHRHHH
jgi:predicted Fe-Mo cluster-binding NifX family protein